METYPLNADQLNKGDTIDQRRIAEFLGAPLNSKRYQLGVLRLAAKVAKVLEVAGKPCTVVVTKRTDPIGPGGIRVLTDAEALPANGRGFKVGVRKAFRKHRKTQQIDAANLTTEERSRLERTLTVQGAILSSVCATRAKLTLKPAARNAPAMIENKSE